MRVVSTPDSDLELNVLNVHLLTTKCLSLNRPKFSNDFRKDSVSSIPAVGEAKKPDRIV